MGVTIGCPINYIPSGGMSLIGSDQPNLITGTWTKILLNGVLAGFTDGIEYVNPTFNCITIPRPGLYIVLGQVSFCNVVADKNYSARILKGNSAIARNEKYTKAGIDPLDLPMCREVYLEPGADEDITLWALSEAGVDTVDIKFGFGYTNLTVQRIR